MPTIPLEDSFTDILAKTQRGRKLTDEQLAAIAGVRPDELAAVKGGQVNEPVLRRLAEALHLGGDALVVSARKSWAPAPIEIPGLQQFNTVWEDMTVNFYLAWDAKSKEAVVFDTGADCSPALEFARQQGLRIELILLTHTHPDHIADLERLQRETGAPVWVGRGEKFPAAQAFEEGKTFKAGALRIGTCQTSGHAAGGMTFVVKGLSRPVAVVGDALFAGSMGGGLISFAEALENNRRKLFTLDDRTVVCAGHGPLTTIAEEKDHNPFYPEFQTQPTSQQKDNTMSERIGVVGVGRMGANMARRLKDVGYPVTGVFDVRAEAAAGLAQELGAEHCQSLARVTELADVIITVVTDDKAMLKIYGPAKGDSLLAKAKGRLFINCATISPKVHVEVEKLCQKAGAESLEACMASSITQAREGTLYLMCGGSEVTFNKAKPILEKLSGSMRYVGKAGQAAVVKALVNMVMNINTAGLAEGLGLGAAYKLDLGMLREVFSQTGANSRVLATDGEDMQNREHSCFFSASHAAKDSGIALSLAKAQGLNLPLATATFKQFTRMTKEGLGELDKSGVAELTFKGRHKGKKKRK
jgi:3-hydroxyisobutyrate dehydrogenase-like beta-hydroxyacid dehydrogenase/glyoxylase-like metal-dependent hydrolase (beta-lactamase superfamily II)